MVIRHNSELDADFFYIWLTNDSQCKTFHQIADSRSGTLLQITFDSIEYFTVLLPPLPEQKAIAAVLGSLDDKIELLRKQNETLEALAQTLFKRWFIDFNFPYENGNHQGATAVIKGLKHAGFYTARHSATLKCWRLIQGYTTGQNCDL